MHCVGLACVCVGELVCNSIQCLFMKTNRIVFIRMNKLNIENDLPVNRKISIWLDELGHPANAYIELNCTVMNV